MVISICWFLLTPRKGCFGYDLFFFPYYFHGTALCFYEIDAHLPSCSLPPFHFLPDCEFHIEVGQVFYANLSPSIIFFYYNSSKM